MGSKKLSYLGLVVLVTTSCGQAVTIEFYNKIGYLQVNGQTDAAVEEINNKRDVYGSKGRLQYLMDLGLALSLAGHYRASNNVLSRAEVLVETLYTKSVSAHVGSLFSSDLLLPFRGEPFEQAYINVIKMINYLKLGKLNDALIETRRAEKRIDFAASLNKHLRFKNDPFIHYMAGLMYQATGQCNDALISYKKAIRIYRRQYDFSGVPLPGDLPALALLCAKQSGDTDAADMLTEQFPGADSLMKSFSGKKLVILLQLAGFAPVKVERIMEITIGRGLVWLQGWDVESEDEDRFRQVMSAGKSMAGRNITIAVPVYRFRGERTGGACISVGVNRSCASVVDDLDRVARACLEDEMPGIMAKTVARAVLKFVTAEVAERAATRASSRGWVGLLTRMAVQSTLSALEHADIRVWGTLPARVRIAILPVYGGGEINVTAGGLPVKKPRCYPGNTKICFMIVRTP